MTEAIDTVMSPEERIKFDKRFTTGSVNLKGLAEAQAEISFPKGEKQGYERGYKEGARRHQSWLANVRGWRNPEQIKELVDGGRKEVVEWIENHGGSLDGCREEWQAFKKKLGL